MNAILRDIATTQLKAPKHSVCTVELHGVKFDCLYDVDGQYHAETRDTPAEYPTADLIGAFIGGVDVMELVYAKELQTDLEHLIEDTEIRNGP